MMAPAYKPVDQNDTEDALPKEEVDERQAPSRLPRSTNFTCVIILLLISLLVNGITFGLWRSVSRQKSPPLEYAISKEVPIVYKPFWWNTEYSSTNYTEQDTLWDAILPSHGFIAMDRQWASSKNWPQSMYLPEDDGKGVYLLEAYHQLHCLKILRKTMGEALTGQPFTWQPGAHIEHCFDHLLQAAKCNADSTPLYTFGDNTAGDGQVHQCRDWDALRDYATENRACYRDTIDDVLLREHFGYCDDGHDGLIKASSV